MADEADIGAERGAGGAQALRAEVGNLMNAVRGMLNNIELAPAPRDNEVEDDPPQDWD